MAGDLPKKYDQNYLVGWWLQAYIVRFQIVAFTLVCYCLLCSIKKCMVIFQKLLPTLLGEACDSLDIAKENKGA